MHAPKEVIYVKFNAATLHCLRCKEQFAAIRGHLTKAGADAAETNKQ